MVTRWMLPVRGVSYKRSGRSIVAIVLLLSSSGCIDDFSHPGEGYVDDGNGKTGGNGSNCTSVCERANDCPDSGIDESCSSRCAEIDRLSENAGCVRQWDALIECDDDIANICRPTEDDCSSEGERFLNCISDYCVDYPDDCEAIF
ncbi:MAG TPA: hypothetical protein VF103_10465 [Polyangiaceae bacterium]